MVKALVILLGLSLVGCGKAAAQAQASPPPAAAAQPRVQDVGTALTTTMLNCPAKIWPDYNWSNVYAFLKIEGQAPMMWDGQTGKTTVIADAKTAASVFAFEGTYEFSNFQQRPAVAVYFSQDDIKRMPGDEFFQFFIHEGFHRFGQKDWKEPAEHRRGTVYPLSEVPRLYRRMTFDNLKAYYLSKGKDKTSLGKASFWFAKWKAEFPEELANSMDNIEGTARYAEFLGPILAKGGCGMTEDQIYNQTLPLLGGELGSSFSSADSLSLDDEAYDMGSLAGYTLRFIEKNTAWQARAKVGDSAPVVLFGEVDPIADVIPADLQAQYVDAAKVSNEQVATYLDADLALLKDPTALKIGVDDENFKGSYSPYGFYLLAEFPNSTLVPLALPLTAKMNDGQQFTVNAGKVRFDELDESPCDGDSTYVVPANSAVTTGTHLVLSGALQGSTDGVLVTLPNGQKWFCQTLRAVTPKTGT